jgi:SpoVK/Ycf46/Vps4 family AAA+-type ATPase
MLRLHLRDGALAAAKAWSHARVEPRHVAYAITRHFRDDSRFAGFLAPAKDALGPHGSAHEVPTVSPEAEAMLASIDSAEAALASLQGSVGDGAKHDAPSGPASAAPTKAEGAPTAPDTEAAADTPPETVEAVLEDLDRLVGLQSVKEQVRAVIAVVRANQARAAAGHPIVNPGLHLVFTGSPGTGKTTVARLIARLYAASGALPGSSLTEVDRSDLVAGYVGQTAIRTAEVIERSRPGVLFIDEAYALAPSHASDFGAEAIATIVKAMEDHRHELAVIVAGYEDEMEGFLVSNPGLRSRFKTFIRFPDYAPEELTSIFESLVNAAGLRLDPGALAKAVDVFREASREDAFGNARFARSLFEQAYTRMALRAAADGEMEMNELMTLAPEDLVEHPPRSEARERRIGFRDEAEGA